MRPLTLLSFALAGGLAGCNGAGPTGPAADPTMDPAPLALQQPAIPLAVAGTLQEITTPVLHPRCPRRPQPGPTLLLPSEIRVCETAASAAGR
jgi:hypothetical protein